MSGKMNWILVCECPKDCILGLKTKEPEETRAVCINCYYGREIEEQEYAGLGRM